MKITVNASKRLRKPVLVAPFGQDSDEEDAQPSSRAGGAEVRPPQDAGVRDAADKLAEFVASKGRQFEAMTRDRNPGDTPFRFLHDMSSCEYKYYNAKVLEHEAKLGQQAGVGASAPTWTPAGGAMIQPKDRLSSAAVAPASGTPATVQQPGRPTAAPQPGPSGGAADTAGTAGQHSQAPLSQVAHQMQHMAKPYGQQEQQRLPDQQGCQLQYSLQYNQQYSQQPCAVAHPQHPGQLQDSPTPCGQLRQEHSWQGQQQGAAPLTGHQWVEPQGQLPPTHPHGPPAPGWASSHQQQQPHQPPSHPPPPLLPHPHPPPQHPLLPQQLQPQLQQPSWWAVQQPDHHATHPAPPAHPLSQTLGPPSDRPTPPPSFSPAPILSPGPPTPGTTPCSVPPTSQAATTAGLPCAASGQGRGQGAPPASRPRNRFSEHPAVRDTPTPTPTRSHAAGTDGGAAGGSAGAGGLEERLGAQAGSRGLQDSYRSTYGSDRQAGGSGEAGAAKRSRSLGRGGGQNESQGQAASEGPPEEQQVEAERIEAEKALAAGDKLAAMEAFMKLAAKKDKLAKLDEDELEERRRKARPESVLLNETAYDRRRVTAVFRDDGRKGHHMQDFIPPEELAKVLAKSGDTAAAQAVEAKTVIDSSNIGHKLLKKMGWSEGKGLGSTQAATAITAPVQAASMKQDQQGLGAGSTSQAGAEDPFESYRQRMMLGYKHRPNPLGNPRKSYY